jgi:xylose isomerase
MSLLVAAQLLEEGHLEAAREARYAGWREGLGTEILDGKVTLADLEQRVAAGAIDPSPSSGEQERLENLVNRALWRSVASA